MMSLGFLAFLVVTYFAYDLVKNDSNPCGQLFEQTTVSLTAKIDVLEKDTSLIIGRNRIQELSASAQQMALSLQSCCIASQTNIISGEQFLQCQTGTSTYANRLDAIAARLAELETSKNSEVTTIAMAEKIEVANTQTMSRRMPVPPTSLKPQSAPLESLPKTNSSANLEDDKKIQLDKLINKALDASLNFQKNVDKAVGAKTENSITAEF